MNIRWAITRLFVFSAAVALIGAESKKPVALFDGKTFEGWEGDLSHFRIENGAIVGGNLQEKLKQNEFLATKKEYANFDLKLKFKLIGPTANGGVQFRSQRVPDGREMIGYQADMGDGYWGSLYDESRRKKTLAAPKPEEIAKVLHHDDWNDYRLLCEGRHIQLWVNGLQTVDYTESDETLPQKGFFGLQIHAGKPSEVWYKDLSIVELP